MKQLPGIFWERKLLSETGDPKMFDYVVVCVFKHWSHKKKPMSNGYNKHSGQKM